MVGRLIEDWGRGRRAAGHRGPRNPAPWTTDDRSAGGRRPGERSPARSLKGPDGPVARPGDAVVPVLEGRRWWCDAATDGAPRGAAPARPPHRAMGEREPRSG